MSKKVVLDTSIPIYDIEWISKFQDLQDIEEVIIPSVVHEEINILKEENSERGYYARKVAEQLDELSQISPLRQGVKIGNILIRTSYKIENKEIKQSLIMDKNDYKIIACAKNENAILISRDRMMRVLARDFVKAEDYEADMIKTEIYKGYRKIIVPENKIELLYREKLENEYGLYPNEFVIMESEWNPQHVGIGICKKNRILPVYFDKMNFKGMKLRPRNLEQKMFLYLLLDPEVLCVSALGTAGRGKTLLPVDYAFSSIDNKLANKLYYTKPTIAIDSKEELGFYPGSLNDKLKPHFQPLYSAVEEIFKEDLYRASQRISVDQKVEQLINEDILMFFPLAHIRGMSIFDKRVILDEGQNTNRHTMKSIVTRLTDTSKLIVTGDVDQIDDRNLNRYNNGMIHLIETGKEEDFIGHITLDIDNRNQRGRLAEFGARKL
ncbi:phosphate starvation-inducible protein PhoH [Bacillus sp. M6-12]|uniref:PhoH family protein n=1 Tax=Bacillus sp. M6-12 TaxID=2054166 RepID=UPI000C77861B|nr:PhoH family protein [Bacillus sp. M6-12]PLS19723.1 phosphate starvation-inducible protein PhoH [Bacillus sp. M6-12]